jgi:hypothetical protein
MCRMTAVMTAPRNPTIYMRAVFIRARYHNCVVASPTLDNRPASDRAIDAITGPQNPPAPNRRARNWDWSAHDSDSAKRNNLLAHRFAPTLALRRNILR